MKKRGIVALGLSTAALAGAGVGATVAAQSALIGPKGEFRSIFALEWKPRCYAPTRPIASNEYAREAYLADVRRYLDCADGQARSDAEYAVAVVSEGREKAYEDFRASVRR